MGENEPATPANEDVSPYLRRPLRSLDRAQQDRKFRQRQTIDETTWMEKTAKI